MEKQIRVYIAAKISQILRVTGTICSGSECEKALSIFSELSHSGVETALEKWGGGGESLGIRK